MASAARLATKSNLPLSGNGTFHSTPAIDWNSSAASQSTVTGDDQSKLPAATLAVPSEAGLAESLDALGAALSDSTISNGLGPLSRNS